MDTPKPLNDKQRRFVDEYLIDLNATQAAIRAGYAASTARQQGSRLLTHVDVLTAIEVAQGKRADRTEITQDMVAAELAKIGFSDVRRLFDDDGRLIPIKNLTDEAAACLSSIEIVTRRAPGGEETDVEHVAKIKLWDKQAALVNLGKHLGMFRDKVDLNVAAKVIHTIELVPLERPSRPTS